MQFSSILNCKLSASEVTLLTHENYLTNGVKIRICSYHKGNDNAGNTDMLGTISSLATYRLH